MLTEVCFFGEENTKCIVNSNHKVIIFKVRLSKKENHLSEWAQRIESKMEVTSFCYSKLKHKSHSATTGKSIIFFFSHFCRSLLACRFPCDFLVELGSDCPRQSKFRTEKLTTKKKKENTSKPVSKA